MISVDTETISRYWLPYGHATVDSLAIDGKDVWFYFSDYREKHLGRITMGREPFTFHEYSSGASGLAMPREPVPNREARMEAMLKERWTDITQGIAAKGGSAWYGEAKERWRFEEPDKSMSAHSEPESWALCRIEAGTGRITKYVFPEPDLTPRSHVGYRISTDAEGRRLAGATYANSVWIFDTRTKKLKRFVLGRVVEHFFKRPDGSEQVLREPELWLKDVAMGGDGKGLWAVDSAGPRGTGALYEVRVDEEVILRHTLQPRPPRGLRSTSEDSVRKTRPEALSLGPDGKVWLTCDAEWIAGSLEECRSHTDRWNQSFIISFDPRISEMTSYRSPDHLSNLEGIVVTSCNHVWYGFRFHERWGVRDLSSDSKGESVQSQPEEMKAIQILDGEATEVDGGEAPCRELDLLEEPPVRRSIQDGSISLELGAGVGMVRKLAEDHEGRIWFSTWSDGCVGHLTPPQT